jgi:hypothetical protein
MRSRLAVCIVGIVALIISLALAGDVTVQQGSITGTSLTVNGNATITGTASVTHDLNVGDNLDVTDSLDVGDDLNVTLDLEVWDTVGGLSRPSAYFGGLNVDEQINASALTVYGSAAVTGDFAVVGKTTCWGGLDPNYLLLDKETREGLVQRVQREVAPGKQAGAVLFFNRDTHRLETYVAPEGKFYDLNGNVAHALGAIAAPATEYKAAYYLDPGTGQVKSYPKAVSKKYRVKSGCRLDEATGQFVDTRTGQGVAREQAVETYNPSDGTYYDLQGQVLRREQSPAQVEYVTEYYLDRHTGEVKSERRPVRQLYVVKKGLRFDKKTGQFTDPATGKAVAAQDAVVQIRQ